MKVLVVGDRIFDQYSYCKATRLCPEGPAPVLIVEKEATSEGGASLVAENLKSLLGPQSVLTEFGSVSRKHRIFADRTLICRIDRDSFSIADRDAFWGQCLVKMKQSEIVVVSDYGKEALTKELASGINTYCLENNKKLFVDCKGPNVKSYYGCFALFPNENEHNGLDPKDWQHIIRKLGPMGCSVDGNPIRTIEQQEVYDVTGAGDVFLAAFVWQYIVGAGDGFFSEIDRLTDAAIMANKAASISVRHLGTYISRPQELL
jgi:bifunctional ADP-heptose synthase (sugar kinase/adenylyltransferase)